MVQGKKHKKSIKPSRKPSKLVMKKGKHADLTQFRSQLDALDLKIIEVTADGNCFFRALADQLDGNEEEHIKYRSMIVQYIRNNRDNFEPFIEDDIPFDEYCKSMEEDGTWGGNMELQAASLVTRRNVCIHRNMSPRWYISNFDARDARMMHLSYHDGEHYNSVRSKDDLCEGPAEPIKIKADANVSQTGHIKIASADRLKGRINKSISNTELVKLVTAGTGCTNVEKIEQVLDEVYGDVDAAIEFLISEETTLGKENTFDDRLSAKTIQNGDEYGRFTRVDDVSKDNAAGQNISSAQSSHNRTTQNDKKKMSRNKECICESKKKYKTCCGSANGISAAKNNSRVTSCTQRSSNKMRKQMKRHGKIENTTEDIEPTHLPDVGALCI